TANSGLSSLSLGLISAFHAAGLPHCPGLRTGNGCS
ncbi:MAG: hypothetical protein ACI8QZ_003317, partial [Chlamydiales bacterium]